MPSSIVEFLNICPNETIWKRYGLQFLEIIQRYAAQLPPKLPDQTKSNTTRNSSHHFTPASSLINRDNQPTKSNGKIKSMSTFKKKVL
jgi:hypothetical protein